MDFKILTLQPTVLAS